MFRALQSTSVKIAVRVLFRGAAKAFALENTALINVLTNWAKSRNEQNICAHHCNIISRSTWGSFDGPCNSSFLQTSIVAFNPYRSSIAWLSGQRPNLMPGDDAQVGLCRMRQHSQRSHGNLQPGPPACFKKTRPQ